MRPPAEAGAGASAGAAAPPAVSVRPEGGSGGTDASAPEARSPEARDTDARSPDARGPEARGSAARAPEAGSPESRGPEARDTDARNPEARGPESRRPEARNPETGSPAARGPGASRYDILCRRPEFLAVSRARRQGTPGFLLQARDRGDGGGIRVGFTCSKKVGNAVARNRAKRRLRAAAQAVIPALGRPGWDYVLVGRKDDTAARDFAALLDDLRFALRKVHG